MKKIMSAAVLTLLVGGAQAQVYVGGGLGLAKADIDCEAGLHCDTSDVGYKAYAGYRDPANKVFGFEVGYLDLGKAKLDVIGSSIGLDVKARAVYLAGALQTNFTQSFGGGVRLGSAYVKTTCTGTIGASSGSVDDTHMAGYVGGNLDYAFTPQLKGVLSLDITRAKCPAGTGSANLPSATVGLLSIGAQYGF